LRVQNQSDHVCFYIFISFCVHNEVASVTKLGLPLAHVMARSWRLASWCSGGKCREVVLGGVGLGCGARGELGAGG
jgi:hypothetical protein